MYRTSGLESLTQIRKVVTGSFLATVMQIFQLLQFLHFSQFSTKAIDHLPWVLQFFPLNLLFVQFLQLLLHFKCIFDPSSYQTIDHLPRVLQFLQLQQLFHRFSPRLAICAILAVLVAGFLWVFLGFFRIYN